MKPVGGKNRQLAKNRHFARGLSAGRKKLDYRSILSILSRNTLQFVDFEIKLIFSTLQQYDCFFPERKMIIFRKVVLEQRERGTSHD